MRIDVRKFLFVGLEKERTSFFEEAQKFGIIEFIDKKSSYGHGEEPQDLQKLNEAIKILRRHPPVEQEEIDDFSSADDRAEEILAIGRNGEELMEESRLLKLEISRVEAFGSFCPEEVAYIENETGMTFRYFFKKKISIVDTSNAAELIHVGDEHGLEYFISLTKEQKNYEGFVEMYVERPVNILREALAEVEEKMKEVEGQLKEYCKYNDFLHQAVLDKLNKYNLKTAQDYVDNYLGDGIFAVEGWVAENELTNLKGLLDERNIHGEEIAIEEEDKIPSHLSNEGYAKIGEDLVHIYDTPSIGDKDPSTWVLWGFALFFGIILGDGGYGAIFLLLSGFLWWKFPKLEGAAHRAVKLLTILSVSCILWGFLSNSFFGISFELEHPIRQVSMVHHIVEQKANYHWSLRDDTYQNWMERYPTLGSAMSGHEALSLAVKEKDGEKFYDMLEGFSNNVMIELALLIGVVHVICSLVRGIRGSWAGFGWILFMIGSYLHFPSILDATSMIHFILGIDKVEGAKIGLELIYGGIGSAVVLGIVQNKLMGILEVVNVIQVFADVLSYLRLYALGLAGAMMSSTFNDIAASMTATLGIVVLIVGHLINIVLSAIGGLIHGLRLHFIEWYHYSFEGGGKLHKPLKMFKIK